MIALVFGLVALVSACTSDNYDEEVYIDVDITVAEPPQQISEGNATRLLKDSEGHTSWEAGDEILLMLKSGSNSQYVTLTYNGEKWLPNEKIKSMSSVEITAYYAPAFCWKSNGVMDVKSGRCAGSDEFIIQRQENVNMLTDGIHIDFTDTESVSREYSRVRAYIGSLYAGEELSLDGMIPAGKQNAETIKAIVDNSGNAFFFGRFSGNASLTYDFAGGKATKTAPAAGSINGKGYFNNLSGISSLFYVDLGLPSGTLWANCNLDAPAYNKYGGYYEWAGTEAKVEFTYTNNEYNSTVNTSATGSNLPVASCTTYYDSQLAANRKKIPQSNDAAYKKKGAGWSIPTYEQWWELRNKCTWTWETIDDMPGYRVTGTNGNSIFLPAVGYYFGKTLQKDKRGSLYMCSTLHADTDYAYSFYVGDTQIYFASTDRSIGYPIRPVYKK